MDKDPGELNLEDFAYQLPAQLIAQHPSSVRDQSRLLYYNQLEKSVSHLVFHEICSILKAGDVLVVNNTQVIPARVTGKKTSGGIVELLLIRQEPDRPELWQAMATPLKKLQEGELIQISGRETVHNIVIEKIFTNTDGQKRLLIRLGDRKDKDRIFTILSDAGTAPLPPYIVKARQSDSQSDIFPSDINKDLERYQTVFAKHPGAVAAPTAGLHFSPSLLVLLQEKGVQICEITLHVGPGTFKPITTSIKEHVLEPEWYAITKSAAQMINTAKQEGRRIIAVGTTTCRALESSCQNGELMATESAHTSLFIAPGYQFRLVKGLLTNFHLSKSSLLLLVAALMSTEELMRAYQIAIDQQYRFYSYGDAMIIL